MPSESEPVYVLPAREVQLDYGFARKLFLRTHDLSSGLGNSQNTENQRRELQPADILVGMGPDEHLMRYFEVCI